MLLLRHVQRVGRRFPVPVLTLGNFDGVHRGHQEILRRLVATARRMNGTAVALTFYPHPVRVLRPERAPQLITDWRARVERIAATGVDVIIVQHFTRAFSQVTAEDFVRRFLVDGLGVRAVVVGYRVSFGHDRAGRAATLRQLGAKYGLDVEAVGPIEVNGMEVSSSAVRRAISGGDLDRARALLGRAPSVAGRVVHGFHRGKGLGFPTANLRLDGVVLPPDGVYAVHVDHHGVTYQGIANLGFNPTFQVPQRGLEVHIFDFEGDLYGHRVEISFEQRLRGEEKFPNPEALAKQIARDLENARRVLSGKSL
jgi:riboflavin kinase/FMN adenylyltransferase